jgi:DNA-binding MarR family transcriptional regulator
LPSKEYTQSEAELTLGLLKAVHEDASLTQRSAAQNLGVALGLVNTYVKRCVKKGLIKVMQAPSSRYAYYLTPKGFSEKSRLTAEFLSQSFKLVRLARVEYTKIMSLQMTFGKSKIAIFGASDLTDIIVMCAHEQKIELIGIVAPGIDRFVLGNIPVVENASELAPFDLILVADLVDPQCTYDQLVTLYGHDRVHGPLFLGISTVMRKPTSKLENISK